MSKIKPVFEIGFGWLDGVPLKNGTTLFTSDQMQQAIAEAIQIAISQCKNASGQHKAIDTYVNATQILHDVMGTDHAAPEAPK